MMRRAASVGGIALLVVALLVCSLGLITSQHRARGLFVEVERAQQMAQQLEAEGNRLRVELGRASQPASVEAAARHLGLRPVDSARTAFLPAPAASGKESK